MSFTKASCPVRNSMQHDSTTDTSNANDVNTDPISASVHDNYVTIPLKTTEDVGSVSKKIRKTNKSLTHVSDKDWNDLCDTISKLPFQYIGRSNTYSHRKPTPPRTYSHRKPTPPFVPYKNTVKRRPTLVKSTLTG